MHDGLVTMGKAHIGACHEVILKLLHNAQVRLHKISHSVPALLAESGQL
jgi:hypothetical protein